MNQPDLKKFAILEQKIPNSALLDRSLEPIKKVSFKNTFFSHFVDFSSLIFCYLFISKISFIVFGGFFHTESLLSKYHSTPVPGLKFISFSIIAFSYFFFSYFLNHGQTLGMHYSKLRVGMPYQSFKASLVWSLYSLTYILTLGIFSKKIEALMKRKNLGYLVTHDYLYQSLLAFRQASPINLVKISSQEKPMEEDYKQAA